MPILSTVAIITRRQWLWLCCLVVQGPPPSGAVLGERAALSIVLLMDTSNSLSASDLGQLQKGAGELAGSLGVQDQLRLVTFSETAKFLGATTATTLNSVFRTIHPQGETALRDALIAGLELTSRSDTRRPVLIVFSDGADTASWFEIQDVERAAKQGWASLFAVTPRAGAYSMLRSLSELTGGEVLVLDQGLASLPAQLARILDKLRQRYVVAFDPSSAAIGWHELDVRVRRPGQVTARKGYIR